MLFDNRSHSLEINIDNIMDLSEVRGSSEQNSASDLKMNNKETEGFKKGVQQQRDEKGAGDHDNRAENLKAISEAVEGNRITESLSSTDVDGDSGDKDEYHSAEEGDSESDKNEKIRDVDSDEVDGISPPNKSFEDKEDDDELMDFPQLLQRMTQKKNVVAQLQRQISESLDVERDSSFSEVAGMRVNEHAGEEWQHPEPDDPDFNTPYIAIRTNYEKYPQKELPDPKEVSATAYYESINKYREIKRNIILQLRQEYMNRKFRNYYQRFHEWLEKVNPGDANPQTVNTLYAQMQGHGLTFPSKFAIRVYPGSSAVFRLVSPPPGFAPLFPTDMICNKAGQLFAMSDNDKGEEQDGSPVMLPLEVLEEIERSASVNLERIMGFGFTVPTFDDNCHTIIQGIEQLLDSDDDVDK